MNYTGEGGLHPGAPSGGIKFQMSERWYHGDPNAAFFSHIGVYCHEFGHLLGAQDEYDGDNSIDPTRWDLMSNGNYNGPTGMGECPAGFDPFYRIKWNWANVNYLNDMSYNNYSITYNYQQPNYYRLDNPFNPGQYFLIENRLRAGFDKYTPNDPLYPPSPIQYDPNGNEGGLVVWTIDESASYGDRVDLRSAFYDSDPYYNPQFGTADPFPYNNPDGISGVNINDNTIPNNKIRNNGNNTKINFTNITWNASTKNISLNITRNFANDFVVVSSNTTWSSSQVINKHLLIMPNTTLTINPGVTLQFDPTKKIIISDNGTLNAVSTGSPIIFTKNGTSNWAGIELYGVESNLIASSLTIQNATNAITLPKSKSISLSNINFRDNTSTFSFSGSFENANQIDVRNCKIINTPFSLTNTNNGGLTLNYYNNTFNSSPISTLGNITLTLINNDFKVFGQNSITLSGDKTNVIKNNIFYNTIISNTTKGNSLITYNCIYPTPTSQVAALFSGQGNFSADPLFAVPGNLESQSLQQSSPCIDMGDPTMDYNNEPGSNGGRINIGSLGNTTLATVVAPNTSRNLAVISLLGSLSLSSSSNWSVNSNYTILDDKTLEIPNLLTINSGISLTLKPGVKLNFLTGASLVVNGTLTANETSTNKIIFNRSGATGLWGSLKFDGTGATSSILSNVEVYNATSIQILNDANVTVKNSIIQNCNQGVYIYNASPQIINNQISDPILHGIYVNALNKSPLIQDNTITKTSGNANYKYQEGIILYNGTNGYITHNSISGFDHGIYVGGSNAYFTDYTWQNHYPNNKFTFNKVGIRIGWGAYLIGGYGMNICWNNNISNNDNYNIFVYASSRALVQNNYWGVGNLKQYVDPTSTWEILPALSTDPWLPQGGSQAIAVVNTSSSQVQTLETTDKSTSVSNTTSMAKGQVSNDLGTEKNEDEILKEIGLEKEGKIDEAIEYLKKMVKNKKNSLYAITVLGGLKERYGKENVQLYFEDLLTDPNEGNKPRIKKHLAGFYLNKDEDNKATAIFDELKNSKSSKRDNFEGLLDKFNYMLHKKKDVLSAKNLLAEMKNKFSDDEDAIMHISTAEMLITEGDNFALGKKQNKTEAALEIEIPKEYTLFNNYPNPFNPITTINYQLPKSGSVTLKIFDILGKEVKTLVNEQKEMGKYTVQFDASSLASGMYVYQLRVNDYTSTKKMLLLK